MLVSPQLTPEVGLHGVVEKAVQVAAVGPRHARRADDVLQQQVPPDHEGHELPDRDVGVHVGGPAQRHPGPCTSGHGKTICATCHFFYVSASRGRNTPYLHT